VRTIAAIEKSLDALPVASDAPVAARALLAMAEEVLEAWTAARGAEPTMEEREGFRLLALHRQGAQDTPSFNACRETCREIAYHYNVITLAPHGESAQRVAMMAMLVRHLALFVGGKMQVEKLGDFCCASRPLRLESAARDGESPGERNA
jgi:hypothetical protein